MANKVGKLIKQARTDAGLTQEQLARKVKGVSTADIGKAERGQLKLTNDQLKQIAKATGVTQKSLIEAAASSSYSNSDSSAKKPSTAKETSSTSSSSGSKSTMKLTATEKQLVELYRKADSDKKKQAMSVLKGTDVADVVGDFLGSAINSLFKK